MRQFEDDNTAEILNVIWEEINKVSMQEHSNELKLNVFSTPLGKMLSLSDERYLYLLEFVDKRGLDKEIKKLIQHLTATVVLGSSNVASEAQKQLQEYFSRQRTTFSLPLFKEGTAFQKKVWTILETIPVGRTLSYQEVAVELGNIELVRAVGNANGANKLAVVIPCHRVIRANGKLGGYAGGSERKAALLKFELANVENTI